MKLLILYASRRGSTAEVAKRIADIMGESALDVDLCRVDDFSGDMSDYDAYIFGTNIYNGMWNHSLTEKIRLSLNSIRQKPVWGWAMCIRIMEEDAEAYLRRDYMPATLIPRINLQGFKFFAGKLLYEDINLEERWTLSVRYDGMREPNEFNGDYREWDRIEAWARSVASQIRTFA